MLLVMSNIVIHYYIIFLKYINVDVGFMKSEFI